VPSSPGPFFCALPDYSPPTANPAYVVNRIWSEGFVWGEYGSLSGILLVYCTDELLQDARALDAFLREACPNEIAFATDDAIINGVGGGQPLGILNAESKISVSKETGQAAATRELGDVYSYIGMHIMRVMLYGKHAKKSPHRRSWSFASHYCKGD
jgi:hypothetical protein